MRERQLAAARLHESYAARLERQASQPEATAPTFLAAVADTLRVPGAAAVLYSQASRSAILLRAAPAVFLPALIAARRETNEAGLRG